MKKKLFITFLLLTGLRGWAQTPASIDNEKLLDLMQNQRYKEASSYIKSIYPLGISDKKMLLRLAYCNYMGGNLQEAEQNYLSLYHADTSNVGIIVNLANILIKRGNYPRASDYLKTALAIDSTNFMLYKQLGEMGQQTGDTSTLSYLEKAHTLNSTDPDIAYDLSMIYVPRKNYKKAEQILNEAIAADSTNLLLLRTLSKVTYAQDNWPKLIELSQKLTSLGDETIPLLNMLGEAYYHTRNYRKCIETLKKVEQQGAEGEGTLYFMARSYKNLNDQAKAIEYFTSTIKAAISPNVGNYYTELGDSREKLNQNKSALASYLKSLAFEKNSFTYYIIANLYDQKLNDKTRAKLFFRKFIKSATAEKLVGKQYMDYAQSRIAELTK